MKSIISFTLLLILAGTFGIGQQMQPNMSFEKTMHDFGDLNEKDGEKTYSFKFTNTGSQPLILNNVKPSCGCTTPKWSREPVMPGATGFIDVKFNPKGRPGPFNKSIAVHSNSMEANTVLRITGNVIAAEKTTEDRYPYAMGDIRLKRTNVYFSDIAPDQTQSSSLDILNTSDKPVTLSFKHMPPAVSISSEPSTLEPGQEGKISVTYDAAKANDWGLLKHMVTFSTDNKSFNNRILVIAKVQEDFSDLSAQELANAPKASFSESEYDFGSIPQGKKIEHAFKVLNDGNSNLIIRKVKASCGCTAVQPEKSVIEPGESTNIKVIFDSNGRKGRQMKTVTVITNDPKNVEKILHLKGMVDA